MAGSLFQCWFSAGFTLGLCVSEYFPLPVAWFYVGFRPQRVLPVARCLVFNFYVGFMLVLGLSEYFPLPVAWFYVGFEFLKETQ